LADGAALELEARDDTEEAAVVTVVGAASASLALSFCDREQTGHGVARAAVEAEPGEAADDDLSEPDPAMSPTAVPAANAVRTAIATVMRLKLLRFGSALAGRAATPRSGIDASGARASGIDAMGGLPSENEGMGGRPSGMDGIDGLPSGIEGIGGLGSGIEGIDARPSGIEGIDARVGGSGRPSDTEERTFCGADPRSG
jgi:hypothetical protein